MSYGLAPRVVLRGDLNTEFSFIPDHLAIIVTEVLKNALRATVEFHTLENSIIEGDTASKTLGKNPEFTDT